MTHRLVRRFLTAFCLLLFVGGKSYAQPVWKFSVVVAVEKQTADYYRQTLSKPIDVIVKEQLATINANFNSSANFKGVFDFHVDSVYVFDGDVRNEVFRSHPKYDYNLVINGFSDNSVGGGWYGSYHTIYHSWPWDYFNGTFGEYALDGLTHEFGHSRGAIDIYALRVEGKNNPINNETFEPVSSIMNYPYGNITWDEHTTNILNHFEANAINDDAYISGFFPEKIGIKTVDSQGQNLQNVTLDVYPVDWFSYTVSPSSIVRSSTNNTGVYQFSTNPFQPNLRGYPWNMRYSNFLIKAVYNSTVVYKWMPLYDVQNAYFKNGATAYNAEIKFPADTPLIRLTSVSATNFCQYPSSDITVAFTAAGAIQPGNTFTLQLSDANGNFENGHNISAVTGTSSSTLTASLSGYTPGINYRIRVIGSQPTIRSDEQQITIKPNPDMPGVRPVDICQNVDPPILAATGQNLRWYTTNIDGTGAMTAPPINTKLVGRTVYYVSQTVDGCESYLAYLSVTVKPLPEAPGTLSKSVCQFAAPESVTATGINLTWYDMDGTKFAAAPIVNTDKAATVTYQITQTLTGCEGPKATLVVTVRPIATATLTGSQTILEGQSATLLVALTGDAPWVFSYRDSTATGVGTAKPVQASASPYTVTVNPVKTTAYHLTSVSNVCGNGKTDGGIIVVDVMPLLGIDDQSLADVVAIFPVPASSAVTVRIRGLSAKTPATVVLTDLAGQPVSQQETAQEISTLTLDQQPAGVYILQIRVGSRLATKRIVKL